MQTCILILPVRANDFHWMLESIEQYFLLNIAGFSTASVIYNLSILKQISRRVHRFTNTS